MSISMNKSSEATTQLNAPASYLINSTTLDDYSLNSFYSPRAGSVTVIGKRISSNSCISPSTVLEPSRFPIAIKSITRIKRQTTQVKLLLKRKTSKIKFPEQPAPPVSLKPNRRINSSTMYPSRAANLKKRMKLNKVDALEKDLKHEKIEKTIKISPQTKINSIVSKTDIPLTERSSVRIRQIIQKSIKKEIKKKKRQETLKNKEKAQKLHKRIEIEERNSKIRIENSLKFKKEKFAPKVPWGIDSRKFEDPERTERINITENPERPKEDPSEDWKPARKSPGFERKTLGLSNFWEIAEEIGFRRRSSSIQTEDIQPQSTKQRKKSDPKVRMFIRSQKRRMKALKKEKLIENIQKETRRISGLKILDLRQSETSREKRKKSSKKRVKVYIHPKKSIFNQASQDDLAKVYEDKSSDFVFEPDSALKQGMSSFTQDSEQEITKVVDDSLLKLNAAIKLQYYIRKFLKKKKRAVEVHAEVSTNSNYNDEDTEVQNILNSWTNPNKSQEQPLKPLFTNSQISNLEKMRQNEINELIEVGKLLTQDPKVLDSLTEMIGTRYQNIAEMLKQSHLGNSSSQLDPSQTSELSKDLQKEVKALDLTFPSYRSDKSLDNSPGSKKNEQVDKASPSEIMIFNELKLQNLSFEELPRCELNPFKHPYMSIASPNSDLDEEQEHKVGSLHQSVISPNFVLGLSEMIISRMMLEVMGLYMGDQDSSNKSSQSISSKISKKHKKSIDKDPISYIDQLFFQMPELDLKLKLMQSVYINPFDLLIQIQVNERTYSDFINFSSCIFPENIFEAILANRLSQVRDEQIKDLQQAHDKMLFDSCNELLQEFRPYKQYGEPPPWSWAKRVMNEEKPNLEKIRKELEINVWNMNEYEAGKIFDMSFNENGGDNEAIQNLREEKIGSLIMQSILGGDKDWVDYEFEEAQVCIDLADWVFDLLAGECAGSFV